ncbi:MAG: metal ABC transporter ATP-binding protein [Verrucomicrobiae bacterium]|nr:metal ABC transporter ATP-binding protein [Verrucomicrobiae bacterium]
MSAIEAMHLSVRLGDRMALEDISFQVDEGEFVAVLGPNGAGKTTLVKIFLGLIFPSQGVARIFGDSVNRLSPEWLGYVPQVKTLDRHFPALAMELVGSGLRRCWPGWMSGEEKKTVIAALARVGAEHLAERALGRLSGGELQRVYLARGLIHRPRFILLDEPATGVDVAGQQDMYRILEDYRKETQATILMVTHDWGAAFHHATRAMLLNRRLISMGRPSEALEDEFLRCAFGHVGHAHEMRMVRHD